MTILASLRLELSPFLVFEFDFLSALLLQYPLDYFNLLCRNVEQDETTKRTEE